MRTDTKTEIQLHSCVHEQTGRRRDRRRHAAAATPPMQGRHKGHEVIKQKRSLHHKPAPDQREFLRRLRIPQKVLNSPGHQRRTTAPPKPEESNDLCLGEACSPWRRDPGHGDQLGLGAEVHRDQDDVL
ncbi:hypothetical protein FQA47_014499 [Oryzias melastigma]|uniref:Uncharacterized protein n=1 Tax=Oryzias melastigma TaxID=30732 RepID=A0A834BZD9_ORYME|nr:hypothetical protein FQA47_014499 [Oryzias melastigma]